MSGGAFDYKQHGIEEIIEKIEDVISKNDSTEKDEWGFNIGLHYSPETIAEFMKAVKLLKKAKIYANRIDWLLSFDDDEDSFHVGLKKDLDKI